ncbi:MAG: DUF429 domain-containing protein [Bacteroidota bacterium]
MDYIGLDGCKTGWIVVAWDRKAKWEVRLIPHISSLLDHYPDPKQVLIDIPIGLPFRHPRLCDGAARKVLTRLRGSSVFPVPSRQSLQAPDYPAACEVNLGIMDRKLSKQTWHIGDKILEVDGFLQDHDYPIRECHPEVAFWAMNGKEPMPEGKKTPQGQHDRLGLLTSYWNQSEAVLRHTMASYKRKEVLADDILDATVLAIAASYPLQSLPDKPEMDEVGLPMEIVYPVV